MTSSLESLIHPDKYQVFLMKSPASIPLNFASHPWFVVNKKGVISRWAVSWRPMQYDPQSVWGHLSLDSLPLFQGLRVLYFSKRYYWKGTLIKVIEGDEGSLAARMAEFIENSPQTYPYKNIYSFFGPNSNTYAQWILNHFPESGMRLPWNAFGKNKIV